MQTTLHVSRPARSAARQRLSEATRRLRIRGLGLLAAVPIKVLHDSLHEPVFELAVTSCQRKVHSALESRRTCLNCWRMHCQPILSCAMYMIASVPVSLPRNRVSVQRFCAATICGHRS